MTSFDHVVGDLNNRSICYQLLRVSRRETLLGKTLAQMLLYALITFVNAGCLLLLGISMFRSLDVGLALPGLLLAWALINTRRVLLPIHHNICVNHRSPTF